MAPADKEVGSLTNMKVDYVICYRYATAGELYPAIYLHVDVSDLE
jgi:hypothetical protein